MDKNEILESNRSELRAFYSVLKDAAPEFLLITGVVKLVKASVFSELNNLKDISFKPEFTHLCGLTQNEIEMNFAPEIETMASTQELSIEELLSLIKKHYNGFCFAPKTEGVYNPFSTVSLFDSSTFDNYWADSGTPSFLTRLMKRYHLELSEIEKKWMPKSLVDHVNPDRLDLQPLLLQTGYLTICGSRNPGYAEPEEYYLDFPNLEVKRSFVDSFLENTANLN